MAVYLYTPPTWRNPIPLGGALIAGVRTCTLVYRRNGVWVNQMEAGIDNPIVANCDVDPASGLRLYFVRPMVIPDSIVAGLSALQPADPSWTPGSLTLL